MHSGHILCILFICLSYDKICYCNHSSTVPYKCLLYRKIIRGVCLEQVIEDVYQDWRSQNHTIRNGQAILMLLLWLPDIQSHDIQNWLMRCLTKLCTQDMRNR